MTSRTNLLDFSPTQLIDYCLTLDEKPFRAKQLQRWIHQSGISDFSRMNNLAKSLRQKLSKHAHITAPSILAEHQSLDGTRKWLLDIGQGNAIETVYIPEATRGTLCISTQVGCAINCLFCSTGKQGFSRNLTTSEIIGQLWLAEFTLRAQSAEKNPQRQISNVVLMGMGEPLLNFDASVRALQLMLDDNAYGLSRRRVTVSTSGIVPMIDRLAETCPVSLAVSLHAPNDTLRNKLVPINQKHSLSELMDACHRYLKVAPRDFITFEYCMLDGINDNIRHAQEIVALVQNSKRPVSCKFNLIPFNTFSISGLKRSKLEKIQAFAQVLMDAGIVTTVRKTRGDDIEAACGLLAGEVQDRTNIEKRLSQISVCFTDEEN